MAEPYLTRLRSIVERSRPPARSRDRILCKHFFGGAAGYADGRIFMTLTTVGLALKLPEDDRNTLFAEGAKPLGYFPQAPLKKEYVLLPSRVVDDESALWDWVSRSIAFVTNGA